MMWRDVGTTERLLSQAAQGDCAATVELFDRELEPMYQTACLLLGNPDDALEMVRQSVSAAVDNLGELKDASRFSSWAKTLVVSRTLQHMFERHTPILNADSPGYDPMAEERCGDLQSREILEVFLSTVRADDFDRHDAAQASFRRMLQSQLQSLPEDLRIAFVLQDILGFRTNETSAFLGVSPEDAKGLLAAARHTLVMNVLNALRNVAAAMGGSDATVTILASALGHMQLEPYDSPNTAA